MKKPPTVKELFRMYTERYTHDQIAESIELQTLYQYLADQSKRAGGNFIHIPSDYLCSLVKKHLDVNLELEDQLYTKEAQNVR